MSSHRLCDKGRVVHTIAMDNSAKIVAFIGTRNPQRAKDFYRDTLGLNMVSEDSFALVFDVKGTMLRVSTVPELTPAKFTVLGWEVSDIVTSVNELQKAGVVFERYNFPQDELGIWTAPGGARIAWFKDPDSNILSLSQHQDS
jgi:catechol 2,3-dioxygenase-like lactoylglutathione lyase family enzyme